MSLKRYSHSGVVNYLTTWIAQVEATGLYSKFGDADKVHLKSIDEGHLAAAKSLLEDLSYRRLLKREFKRLVELRWESAVTLPVNKHLFSDRTGYAQVRGKSKEICFDYGKYNFDSNIVYSLFSQFF